MKAARVRVAAGAPPAAAARLVPANTAKAWEASAEAVALRLAPASAARAREAVRTRASAAALRTAGAAAKATGPVGKRLDAS